MPLVRRADPDDAWPGVWIDDVGGGAGQTTRTGDAGLVSNNSARWWWYGGGEVKDPGVDLVVSKNAVNIYHRNGSV